MTSSSDTARRRALDLGIDDWTWLYELAFWLSPDGKTPDHFTYVPAARVALADLLDDGLVEVATFDRRTGSYSVLGAEAARSIVADRDSWQTAADLAEQGSDLLFAYGVTTKGRHFLLGAS